VTVPVAAAVTDDFRVIELSRNTARLVGLGAYVGITVDVQALSAKIAPPSWQDIIRWIRSTGPTFPVADDHSYCGTTITVDANTTISMWCNPA
jgi:hypothetical protein